DRSSRSAAPQSAVKSWSDAQYGGDRTRLASSPTPETQGTPDSRSSAKSGVDRRRSVIVSASKPRVTESWSDLRERVDRIRIEDAATQNPLSSLSWTTRSCAGGAAVSAATIALFLSAPAAFADAQPSGTTPVATAGQVTPSTSDTTSTSSSILDAGTPASDQSTTSQSSTTLLGTDTSPTDAGGGASGSSDTGGDGTLHVIVTTAGDPGGTGSSATSTGPPGGTTTGTGTGTTDPAASVGVTPASPTQVDNPPSSNHQDATSDSTASQSGANNGNLSIRVGQGGDTGTVTQGNQANAQASSSATGNVPQTGSDPSATAQSTTAQSSPKNANIDVRVGSPGDIAPVGQQNNAQAGASATGVNASDGQAGGRAAAHATQTSPDNINVIVRVGSPGDNGAVTQQNTVGASAGPNASITPVGGVATAGPAQTDQLTSATNTLTDVTNHGVVSQQLIQTQDGNGPNVVTVGDAGTTPAASSGVGYADATQRDAKNVNVSIRVGSPGTDGTVTQTNGATATGTTTGTANVSVTGAKNQNVSIVLPGTANAAPGTQWAWNWTWTGDGTPPTGATAATAAPTGGSTWNWAWTQQSTSAPAATAPTTTSTGWFTWTWTWKNADGQVWTLTQKQACDCNWTWTWNWDWSTGTPVSTGPIAASAADTAPSEPDPSITYDDGPVSQSNEVAATAQAAVDYTLTGEINVTKAGADPALESQDAEFGQSIANDQTALAVSQATQLNPWNVNSVWGVPVASVNQKNFTWADSFAGAQVTVNHELIQGQDGTDGTDQTYQWVGAQQTASNIQDVESGAQAAQAN